MQPPPPVLVAELFPGERAALLEVLRGLSPEQWARPTACAGWSVHEVVLHILGGDLGILSVSRDGYRNARMAADLDMSQSSETSETSEWETLVAFINRQNGLWVQATTHLSSRVICDLLELTGEGIGPHFAQLDPFALGVPVQWVSAERGPVWMDTAREYTERWTHQQHIRDAVGQPGLKERRWLAPVLAAFVHALPQTLRPIRAPAGTSVHLTITGEAGGQWWAVRADPGDPRWVLTIDAIAAPDARVTLDQEVAWRLFTKGLSKADALPHTSQEGDPLLADRVLELVAMIV